MTNTYEPELMFALDSRSEHADYINVYNVSGDADYYCPICLGRVRLWNGQDENKNYKKQRCFHHIDGMCSHESRVHFAYKTWLLDENSKFNVDNNIYTVKSVQLEQILKTEYGNYKPDIIVTTDEGKIFYVEIANSAKKTDEYIMKWDELGNDVVEIDVNEQLVVTSVKDVPQFKLIYSATTGQCFVKNYIRKDYDELITDRKLFWQRKDVINYKIQWEQLDWFWRNLQDYYNKKCSLEKLCESFKVLDSEDQKFICTRFKNGKHKNIRYELEKYYTNSEDYYHAKLYRIARTIKLINKKYGIDNNTTTYKLHRENDYISICLDTSVIIFPNNEIKFKPVEKYIKITDEVDEEYIVNYFSPIIEEFQKRITENKTKQKLEYEQRCSKIKNELQPLINKINNCKNKLWYCNINFSENNSGIFYIVVGMKGFKPYKSCISFNYNNNIEDIQERIYQNMLKIYKNAINPNPWQNYRLMEVK